MVFHHGIAAAARTATSLSCHIIFTPCSLPAKGQKDILLLCKAVLYSCVLPASALSSIHILLDMNHKAVERIEKSLAFARKAYVESHQKAMSFGFAKGKWMEVEADEAVFDKFLLPSEDSPVQSRVMKWEQWLGMVARGKPASLVLIRLPCVTTRKRAPGPGAIKKVHWTKIAKTWLKGRNIILHTDSARSYKAKVAGASMTPWSIRRNVCGKAGNGFGSLQPLCASQSTRSLMAASLL